MIDVTEIKKSYWSAWENLKESRHSRESSYDLLSDVANLVDGTIKKIFFECEQWSKGIVLAAIGGYARRQMAPRSDIDILILHKGRISRKQKEFLNLFTAAVWDLNVQPGIQIKDVREVAQAAMEDDVVRTSFIDNRYLCGSEKVYSDFVKIVNEKILQKGKPDFLKMKIDSHRNRAKKYRDSIFKLEPNVKEGAGGIRDLNTVYWISKILYGSDKLEKLIENKILTTAEHETLYKNAEFLFKVRSELHYYHNRKYDLLNMDAQVEIAESLGYENHDDTLGVEDFMRDYYMSARNIAEVADKVIIRTLSGMTLSKFLQKPVIKDFQNGTAQYGNKFTIVDKDIFVKNPKQLLGVFQTSVELGLKLSYPTYDVIRENLHLIDDDYRREYGQFFLKVISKFPNAGKVVSRMAKAGILQSMIPEFKFLECKPQFDYYHHYTVDEHTYYALTFIDGLFGVIPPRLKPYQEALVRVTRKDLLALAVLLHDIGKGRGKNHSIVGAEMSKSICRNLGMSIDDTDTVCTIVEHHLLMSKIAERRDLHSPDEIKYFTGFLNSQEELNLLYVLTYGDVNAVGGKIFNEWRSGLLSELYDRSTMVFNDEDLVQEFKDVVEIKRKKLFDRTENNETLSDMIKTVDDEYIYSNKVSHVIRFMNMASSIKFTDQVIVEIDIDENLNSILVDVSAFDFMGLFSRLAGALASLDYNILWAQAYTFKNNIAVDRIIVENKYGGEVPELKKKAITERVTESVLGHIDLDEKLEKSAKSFATIKSAGRKKSKIEFDNNVSSLYTVIDIFAVDRLGLLYNILRVFNKLMLNVIKAKISTDGDRVVDSFYVTDRKGQKIIEEETLNTIKEELLNEIRKNKNL